MVRGCRSRVRPDQPLRPFLSHARYRDKAVVTYPPVQRAGVRKAPRKEPVGPDCTPLDYLLKPLHEQIARTFRER